MVGNIGSGLNLQEGCPGSIMQSRGQSNQAITAPPREADLERLMRAADSGNPVLQTIQTGGGRYSLKIHKPRAGGSFAGHGAMKRDAILPVWSLMDGANVLWEYTTQDLGLIFNLIEQLFYRPAPQAGNLEPKFAGAASAPQGNGAGGNLGFSAEALLNAPVQLSPDALLQQASGGGGLPMKGELKKVPLAQILSKITGDRKTGKLEVTSGLESVEIYFEEGVPKHTVFRSDSMTGRTKDIAGEEVMLEALTWSRGFYQFTDGLKTRERTPLRRIEQIVAEGMALREYDEALEKAGIVADAVPVPTGYPTEEEFEGVLRVGLPVNMPLQKAIYVAVDGQTRLDDIIDNCKMNKSLWLPLIFNLWNCGLISLKGQPAKAAPMAVQNVIAPVTPQSAFEDTLLTESNVFSQPLFNYFLELEFDRALKIRQPFSLILFSVHRAGPDGMEKLSAPELRPIIKHIRGGLYLFDFIGHWYEGLGIILPHRGADQAREQARKIVGEFNDQLLRSGTAERFVWALGIASLPEHGMDLGELVAKAEEAKMLALNGGSEIVTAAAN